MQGRASELKRGGVNRKTPIRSRQVAGSARLKCGPARPTRLDVALDPRQGVSTSHSGPRAPWRSRD